MASADPWPASSETPADRIAEQGHAPLGPQSRPRLYMDLAHAVEIQFVAGIQGFQYPRTFPTAICEALPQLGLLRHSVAPAGIVVGEGKKKDVRSSCNRKRPTC